MGTLVAFTTRLPTQDDDRASLFRKVAERDQQCAAFGRCVYHLLNTVTANRTELVTVIDTLSNDAD
ncbi:hypothetical protein AB0O87_00775 [Microbacterium sp. NPDC076768]|uniref:hypothetical protein n=1 Tax=Microbacterium sp. NPDC076768 TaxID=3154858 RepID=UPI00343ACE2A